MSSSQIQAEVWGEASRNTIKIMDVLNGRLIRAGIYVARPNGPQPDLLAGIVSRCGLLKLRVTHPDNPRFPGFLNATGAFSDAPTWSAYSDENFSLFMGSDQDPAIVVGLITGITAES